MDKMKLLDRETMECMFEAIIDTLEADAQAFDEKHDNTDNYEDYQAARDLYHFSKLLENLGSKITTYYSEIRPK